MTDVEYETHIPRVGRHGFLVEFKDDRTRCMRFREYLHNPNAKFRDEEHKKHYAEIANDDNDTCMCFVGGTGMVWSRLMSDPLPSDAEENVEYYFGRNVHAADYRDYEREEMEQMVAHEQQLRELYMTQDRSLASGDRYRY